ncbi:MAG: acylphosphatase [Thermodesulfobacteriota bacterium]
MKQIRAHVVITGLVQGVFFRASTQDMAKELALTGYVRNCPDGTVEAVFEGPEEKINEAADWCHSGPAGARVEKADIEFSEFKNEFNDFVVRY